MNDRDDVRRRIRKDDFLRSIDEFEPVNVSKKLRDSIRKQYLEPYPDLYQQANHASKVYHICHIHTLHRTHLT